VSAPKKWLLTLVQGFYSVTPWTDFLENGWKKMLKSNGCPSMLEKRKKKKNCFRVWKSAWKLQWHFVGVVDTYPTNLCVWKYMRFNSSGPVLVRIKQGIRVEKRTMCFVFWCVQENVRFWLQCGVQKFASTRPNASIAPFNSKPKFSTP
jgi:hypothetical protein